MSILNFKINFIGEVGVNPRLGRMICNDNFATITAANYVQPLTQTGVSFYPSDLIAVAYGSTTAPSLGWFGVSISNGIITLVPTPAHFIAGTTGTYAGGGTSHAFTVTGLTSSCVGSAVIRTSTNAVSIAKAVPSTNTLTITFSADPGASTTVDYIYSTAAVS